jgi:hypothetical protein
MEEPPETCRAIYLNKKIEKTLHLVGCTLEIYLRCTDIRTSKLDGFVLLENEDGDAKITIYQPK